MPNSEELESFLIKTRSNQYLMSDTEYYNAMTKLARLKRREYGIENDPMSLRLIRLIYKQEGIRIDKARKPLKKVRAAYFCEDGDCSVLLSPNLPKEPKLFSLAHELKHHIMDQDLLTIACIDVTDKSDRIEIGAEVFAAEFIFPISEFKKCLSVIGIEPGKCKVEDVCRLKNECKIPLSYQSICKRLYILKIVPWGSFEKVKFTKVSEELYGVPIYKIIQRRKKRLKS